MTKQIPLTRGEFAIVDDEDYELVSSYKWHAVFDSTNSCRAMSYKSGKNIALHRLILSQGMKFDINGMEGDHINGNSLDNRRGNLRSVTHKQNMRNRTIQTNNLSGYAGVSWYKNYQKWRAFAKVNGVGQHIGYFDTAEEAAKARDEFWREIDPYYASYNFPKSNERGLRI